MATFDQLIQEIESRYSVGSNACRLVQETFALITGLPGGIDGLVDRFKAAGFALEVASWSEGSDPMPLTGQEAEQMLGLDAIDGIANKVGISQSFAKTILGFAIPKIIVLGRQGAIPPENPAAAFAFAASSDSSVPAEELPQVRPCGREDNAAALGRVPLSKLLTGRGFKVALEVCLVAFAFAAGWYSSHGWSPLKAPESDANTQMAEDIRALKASVETLRQAQSHSQSDVALEGLSTRLDTVKTETAAAITGIAGKLDQTQRESEARLSQLIERLDRIEHQTAMPTAAVPPGVSSSSGARANQKEAPSTEPPLEYTHGQRAPRTGSDAVDSSQKPAAQNPPRGTSHLITNWVVRDVYDGIALVESPRGSIEVARGDVIPGAGVVLSIKRRGAGWIVITSRGLVDSVSDDFRPRHPPPF